MGVNYLAMKCMSLSNPDIHKNFSQLRLVFAKAKHSRHAKIHPGGIVRINYAKEQSVGCFFMYC